MKFQLRGIQSEKFRAIDMRSREFRESKINRFKQLELNKSNQVEHTRRDSATRAEYLAVGAMTSQRLYARRFTKLSRELLWRSHA